MCMLAHPIILLGGRPAPATPTPTLPTPMILLTFLHFSICYAVIIRQGRIEVVMGSKICIFARDEKAHFPMLGLFFNVFEKE